MLDHISIRVADYERSKKFYSEALAPLGYSLLMEGSSGAGFRKELIPDFC
jgi:catechol 2,3-dioxygenase-like lactoylglutathione lyase family enzyme